MSQILAICDSERYRSIVTALRDLGINLDRVNFGRIDTVLEATKPYSAAIIEWDLPSAIQLNALKRLQEARPDFPLVALVSTFDDVSIPTRVSSGELVDYVVMTGDEKDDLASLLDCLKRILPELQPHVVAIKDLYLVKTPSREVNEILGLIDLMKDEPGSVLIQGETGTGKEVIARLLHYSGRRHTEPFVAINCAAIPDTLLESELFGHEKGSFTGATEKRIGKFELAHKGTAFLDEIGDMPPSTQSKILRALEMGEIERVGGHDKIPIDIRIVAASNRNLLNLIEKGLFRQDLYYRINTFTITIPPLRERPEDVLPLARYFVDVHAARRREGLGMRLSQTAEELLLRYDWPGNVRELRNAMERAVVLTTGEVIGPEALPEEIRNQEQGHHPALERPPAVAKLSNPTPLASLRELERKAIIEALSQHGNNATKAAKHLGISRATLFRKLKKYGISRQLTIQT